jgi:histidyl-tRNA synthetase
MSSLPQPVKLYYLASIFRYERPQAGRLREHHQFGCEAIGDEDPALDAEVINMAWQFFTTLGLRGISLQLNSIGCKVCRPAYLSTLKNYYNQYERDLCQDCTTRLVRNPLRLLDCKQPDCQEIAANSPHSAEHLCADCGAHFDRLKNYLGLLDIPYSVNHRLVRGLDYYTRTVFEIQPEDGGGQSTLGGGGRYDDLIEELGGRPTPAIGFAGGIERMILNLKNQEVHIPTLPGLCAFIVHAGDAAAERAIKLASELRREGISAVAATGKKSLKAQMRQANSSGARYALILGEDELKEAAVTVRDMLNGGQNKVPLNGLPGFFAAIS